MMMRWLTDVAEPDTVVILPLTLRLTKSPLASTVGTSNDGLWSPQMISNRTHAITRFISKTFLSPPSKLNPSKGLKEIQCQG
jgi:hypothetical protein